jgi:hypothetical protein
MIASPSPTDVFEWRGWSQVVGIDAEFVVAGVVDLEAFWDRTDVEFIEDAVRPLETALVPDLAIPVQRGRPLPDPAPIGGVDRISAVLAPASRVPSQVPHRLALDDPFRTDGLLGDPGIRPAAALAFAEWGGRNQWGDKRSERSLDARQVVALCLELGSPTSDPGSPVDAVALTALPFAVRSDVQILARQCVATLAARPARPTHILRVGHRLEVVRVTARPVSAEMVQDLPLRDIGNVTLVEDAMGVHHLAAEIHLTVPGRRLRPLPDPAACVEVDEVVAHFSPRPMGNV